jgi:Zn-dependent alcohol dehydrogenase
LAGIVTQVGIGVGGVANGDEVIGFFESCDKNAPSKAGTKHLMTINNKVRESV